MNDSFFSTKRIAYAAIVAALYATLTLAIAPLGYGPVQFRVSEALTVLPFFSSFSVLGLTMGCLISNIISPYGILDLIFGSFATLIAAIITYKIGKSNFKFKRYLAPFPAVIINGIIIGILINLSLPNKPVLSGLLGISLNTKELMPTMLLIAIEELIPCYLIGLPLLLLIEKNPKLKKIFKI